MLQRAKKERNAEICRLHQGGWKYKDIAKKFSITEARVWQLVNTPHRDTALHAVLSDAEIHELYKEGE